MSWVITYEIFYFTYNYLILSIFRYLNNILFIYYSPIFTDFDVLEFTDSWSSLIDKLCEDDIVCQIISVLQFLVIHQPHLDYYYKPAISWYQRTLANRAKMSNVNHQSIWSYAKYKQEFQDKLFHMNQLLPS